MIDYEKYTIEELSEETGIVYHQMKKYQYADESYKELNEKNKLEYLKKILKIKQKNNC
jgi:hypothetical protein